MFVVCVCTWLQLHISSPRHVKVKFQRSLQLPLYSLACLLFFFLLPLLLYGRNEVAEENEAKEKQTHTQAVARHPAGCFWFVVFNVAA